MPFCLNVAKNRHAYAGNDPINKSDMSRHEQLESGDYWGSNYTFTPGGYGLSWSARGLQDNESNALYGKQPRLPGARSSGQTLNLFRMR
jgi:hypothetical protein